MSKLQITSIRENNVCVESFFSRSMILKHVAENDIKLSAPLIAIIVTEIMVNEFVTFVNVHVHVL